MRVNKTLFSGFRRDGKVPYFCSLCCISDTVPQWYEGALHVYTNEVQLPDTEFAQHLQWETLNGISVDLITVDLQDVILGVPF